jgi:YidC/Oxa1 family membrane protein insertase
VDLAHTLFALVLGPSSGLAWALSVVFLVLTLRALMIKPFLAQMRSARAMRALSPQLAELRKRHGSDRRRLAEETQKLQRAHGVNPLGALAPALIQLPVFLALLHVLRYFNRPGLTFEQNAAIPNYVFGPVQVRSFLEARVFGAPLSAWIRMPQELLDSFGGHVDRIDVVLVAVPLMVLAAVATHLTARTSLRQQATAAPVEVAVGPTDVAMRVMRATPWIFPLGVLLGGLFAAFPIAILLYWLTNNLWTLVQQRIVFRRLAAAEAARPVPVVVPAPVVPAPTLHPGAKPVAPRRPTSAASRTGGKSGGRTARRLPAALTPLPDPNTGSTGSESARATLCRVRHHAGPRTEEIVQMATTARRIGRIAAASAASAGLLLAGAGPALAGDPGTSATQGPITLSPEQATFLCTQRIPAILARIDRVTARINADVATRGSTAWLQARQDRAEAAGHADVADRIQKRIDARPAKLDSLAGAKERGTGFRDANCAS